MVTRCESHLELELATNNHMMYFDHDYRITHQLTSKQNR